jgi:hypothetical protein
MPSGEWGKIKQKLADAIIADAKKAQMPGYEHPVHVSWQPNMKRFGYKEYKGNVYASLEANDPQTIAYYINGDVLVTHHGPMRQRIQISQQLDTT